MVELLLVRVGLCIRRTNTLGDDLGVAFLVTGVFAVLALHTSRILQKVPTKGASHDIIELLKNKLVAIQFVYLFFTLTYGTFTIQTKIKRSSIFVLFGWQMSVT